MESDKAIVLSMNEFEEESDKMFENDKVEESSEDDLVLIMSQISDSQGVVRPPDLRNENLESVNSSESEENDHESSQSRKVVNAHNVIYPDQPCQIHGVENNFRLKMIPGNLQNFRYGRQLLLSWDSIKE